jgi:hypothetical protein
VTLVRASFPLMVIVSLALHAGLAGGLALIYGGATIPRLASSATPSAETILLRSEATPVLPKAAPVPSAPAAVVVAAPLPQPPAPTPPVPRTATVPVQTLALETNPNAHIRELPPEAVLAPTPPPRLNGQDGVVFILDVSGSMYEPYAGSTRLAFARQELARRIRAMKDGTPFAITLYAQSARNSGPLVAASEATREAAVRFIMRDVDCGGGTNLPAALTSATGLRIGHLVLVSDGDLNISLYNLRARAGDILGAEGHGPGLTIIGVAPRPGTMAERLLQGLADQQGGAYFVEQFDGDSPLFTSASNPTKAAATP